MKLLTTLISLFAIFLLVTGSALPDLTSAPSLDANNLANRSPQNKVEGSADAEAVDQSSASTDNSANTGRSSDSDLLFNIEALETRQGQGSCGSPFESVPLSFSLYFFSFPFPPPLGSSQNFLQTPNPNSLLLFHIPLPFPFPFCPNSYSLIVTPQYLHPNPLTNLPSRSSIPSSANAGRSSDSDLLFDIEALETRQGQGICGPAHLLVPLFF